MNVHVPTTEEIHMIAYLTQHGWTPDGDLWSKDGHIRPLSAEERQDMERDDYHLYSKPDLTAWLLGDAYWYQREEAESIEAIP